MIVIGITGPTGAGKTTALKELEKMGGAVIDCDAVYHKLLESDITLQNGLINEFGDIMAPDNSIDRKKLGAIVFRNPEALERLDRIVYQAITEAVKSMITQYRQKNYKAAAIDGITLFESNLDRLCDTTLAVTAPAEIRIRRIMEREGIPESYARARVEAQKPDEFFIRRCAHSLVNDCSSREAFAEKARQLLHTIII